MVKGCKRNVGGSGVAGAAGWLGRDGALESVGVVKALDGCGSLMRCGFPSVTRSVADVGNLWLLM